MPLYLVLIFEIIQYFQYSSRRNIFILTFFYSFDNIIYLDFDYLSLFFLFSLLLKYLNCYCLDLIPSPLFINIHTFTEAIYKRRPL